MSQTTKQLTTTDLVPVADVRDGYLVTGSGYASLMQVGGLNTALLAPDDQLAVVAALGRLHDLQPDPFQYYCRIRSRDIAPILQQYDRRKAARLNKLLEARFFEEEDYILAQARTAGIVERSTLFVQTYPKQANSRIAGMSGRDDLADDGSPKVPPFRERLRQMAVLSSYEMLGLETPEQVEARLKARSGEPVPAAIHNLRKQRGQTATSIFAAAGMEAKLLEQDEVLAVLAAQLGGHVNAGRDGLASPSFIERPDHLKLGDRYICVLVADATRYPREVELGWLYPLVSLKDVEQLEVSIHYQPIPNPEAERSLRAYEFVLDYAMTQDAYNRKLGYVANSVVAGREMLTRGEGRFFHTGVYVAVSASSLRKLRESVQTVSHVLQTMQLDPYVARLDQWQAYVSTLPLGQNLVPKNKLLREHSRRALTTWVTACTVPQVVASIDHEDGVMLGTQVQDGSLLRVNPWRFSKAPHTIVAGITGSGKTQGVLIEALRWLLVDPAMQYYYIDPQNGVASFVRAVGGSIINFGPRGEARINCLDRSTPSGYKVPLPEKRTFIAGLFELMIGEELPALTRNNTLPAALKTMYAHFEDGLNTSSEISRAILHELQLGWSPEREQAVARLVADREGTGSAEWGAQLNRLAGGQVRQAVAERIANYAAVEHKRGTPILSDLLPYLLEQGAVDLVNKLRLYVDPSYEGRSYNGPTNVDLRNRFVSFNIRDVDRYQRPLVMFMIIEHIWQQIVDKPQRRVLVIDEIGLLLMQEYEAFGQWVAELFKRARALQLRLIAIDQNPVTFRSKYGRLMWENTSIFRLARQGRGQANTQEIAAELGLGQGQAAQLTALETGQTLEVVDNKVLHIVYAISPQQLRRIETFVEGRAAEDERRMAEGVGHE